MVRSASSVMTPDLGAGADAVNGFVDPRLANRIVVTSSSTAVDTDQLVNAAMEAAQVITSLDQALAALTNAKRDIGVHQHLVPAQTATADVAIQTTADQVLCAKDLLQQWLDGLCYAALVYSGAEGNAQAFNLIWQLTGSGSASIGGGAWEGPGAVAGSQWNTGMSSMHSALFEVTTVAEMMALILAGRVFGLTVLGKRTYKVGSAGVPLVLEFTGRRASDAGLLYRAQMDINSAAEMIAWKRLWLARPLSDNAQDTQTWWGTAHQGTAFAAWKVAALAQLGSTIAKGGVSGVSVVGTVPSDVLDPRTGKQVGWMRVENRVNTGGTAAVGIAGIVGAARSAGGAGSAGAVSTGGGSGAGADGSGGASGAGASGKAGATSTLPGASTPRAPARTETPVKASSLLGRVGKLDSSPDHGQFEILRHQTGQKTSWSVVIRGTQAWGLGERNPQDMLTNFQGVAGTESDQTAAVKQAMKTAGIQPGDAVEITGHSQGGIVAGQLASDPEVNQKYRVVSVLTAGSPTGNVQIPDSTHMLNLESSRDIVPALDGTANLDVGNSATVSFDGEMVKTVGQETSSAGMHDMSGYQAALQWMEQHPSQSTEEVMQWSQHRQAELGLGEDTKTTSYLFNTARLGAG